MAFAILPTLFFGTMILGFLALGRVVVFDSVNRVIAWYGLVWLILTGAIALPLTGIYFLIRAFASPESEQELHN